MILGRSVVLALAVSILPTFAAQPAWAPASITVDYPQAETVFPPDFMPPTFQWRDAAANATVWRIEVSFGDGAARSGRRPRGNG